MCIRDRSDGRQECPALPEGLTDERSVSQSRGQPQPDRHLLNEIKHWNQQQLGEYQRVAVLGPGLRGSDDTSGIGVRQHHHDAGTHQCQDRRRSHESPFAAGAFGFTRHIVAVQRVSDFIFQSCSKRVSVMTAFDRRFSGCSCS